MKWSQVLMLGALCLLSVCADVYTPDGNTTEEIQTTEGEIQTIEEENTTENATEVDTNQWAPIQVPLEKKVTYIYHPIITEDNITTAQIYSISIFNTTPNTSKFFDYKDDVPVTTTKWNLETEANLRYKLRSQLASVFGVCRCHPEPKLLHICIILLCVFLLVDILLFAIMIMIYNCQQKKAKGQEEKVEESKPPSHDQASVSKLASPGPAHISRPPSPDSAQDT